MTVELVKPFVWPKIPKDLEPWKKDLWDAREKSLKEQEIQMIAESRRQLPLPSRTRPSYEQKTISQMAKELLSGQTKWKSELKLDEKWNSKLDGLPDSKAKSTDTLQSAS
jgi:large subunit ribosomal protein L23